MGQRLDFLFIDADPSPVGVRSDFVMYSPLVREGGWIGFHDIIPNRTEGDLGIPLLWEALKQKYETVEFIDPLSREAQNGLGIGVLRWTNA